MGSFDVFCALCSGSLMQPEVGSNSKRQREVRRRFIAKKIKQIKAFNGEQEKASVSDQSSEEQWEDAEEVQENKSEDGQELEDEEEEGEAEEEEEEEDDDDDEDGDGDRSYDPVIVNEESVKWLRIVHVLGFNPKAAGPGKSKFPSKPRLFLGELRLLYSVSHPTIIPCCEEVLQKLISETTLKAISPGLLQLADRVRWDPFSILPYDILHSILRFLPGDSIRALMAASWPVYNATRHPGLWKQLMYWGMPWFWELHQLVEQQSNDLDYKKLYLWLDKVTAPAYGMSGPFLGIANRRRIWSACSQLAEPYFSSFDESDKPIGEDLSSVLRESQIMQLPIVRYPQPREDARTISKQLLYTVEERNSRSARLETFWSCCGSLMGLTVIFGTSRRVFGRAMATDGVEKHIIFIDSSDWIAGLALYMSELNLLHSDVSTAVKGIEIIFESGKRVTIKSTLGNHRAFMVSEGHYLVGLVGQTSEDEIISRFGILESPRTRSDEFSIHDVKLVPTSERPFGQQLLWGRGVSPLQSSSASYGGSWPIWNHPNIHVLSLNNRVGDVGDGVPSDLVPYQPLIWALQDHELQKLTQISAYVRKDITSSGLMKCVLGLRAAYTRRYWEPKRYVGEFPRPDNEDGPEETPDGEICDFDIDGPNSEYIVSIEVAMGDFLRAIKIRTNMGREACFGDQNQDHWEATRPADGDMFTGIAATFRPLAGYSTISQKGNRLMMASVVALTTTITKLE
ncbi:hypothetical protein ACJ72_01635 [Emergomyces africanus]|uniref:Uncharacterized protein n=1 Tax=Emergomyces africanus TaxID=1955775 RepID=A0A1B7P4P7_9EURO|nr:hypothetical protein ACJ72_01635 [Emergomyces africanus]